MFLDKFQELTNLIWFRLTFYLLKINKLRNVQSSKNVMTPICS